LTAGALALLLLPNQIGYQDLGALIARRPAVTSHWQKHLIASPFGTIHATTFSMPRPIGATIPPPPLYVLASVDPNEITGAIGRELFGDPTAPLQFPRVNRKKKRDALIGRLREPLPPLAPLPVPLPDIDERFGRFNEYDGSATALDKTPVPDVELPYVDLPPTDLTAIGKSKGGTEGIYFGIDPLSSLKEAIAPWAPGEAPVVVLPQAPGDPDIKLSALTPSGGEAGAKSRGESVARKGVVTGENQRPMSPAERLGLAGIGRAKSEKCLANAIYFESRGEQVRGQVAVAQVVMNRVFSPFYPNDVCGVVYQNAHRHLACQFTFACDGNPDVVTEPDAWARAKHIARDTLDGKLWMPEVAKATHYHAYWVRPSWVNEMRKLYKLGVHTFYRPRAWGDGSDEPTWGDAEATRVAAEKM
jgi:hypothetical protein